MDIFFSVDVEITDHRLSYSENLDTNLLLPYVKLAEYLAQNEIKATFYLSIAPKALGISWDDYQRCLKQIIRINQSVYSDYIRLQPHLHCLNLPFDYAKGSDFFLDYEPKQQVEMLKFSKHFMEDLGVEVDSFRPGGFKNSPTYYESLEEAGFLYSSTMRKDLKPAMDLVNKRVDKQHGIFKEGGITEYPVTSVFLNSVKGGEDTINLSPDFFEYEAIETYLKQMEFMVVNFHSFSLCHGRPVRELFQSRRKETFKHLVREFVLKKISKPFDVELVTNTIYERQFYNWSEKLLKPNNCKWIGE